MVIKSSDNKKFKLYKSLIHKKGIEQNELCLIMGRKIVPEFLNHKNVTAVLATEANSSLIKNSLIPTLFQKELFNELDISGTDYPILVFKNPEIKTESLNSLPQGLEILTGLGEPNNLGALIRSASSFEASKIILLKEACHPFLPKVIKTSSGESLKTPLVYGPSFKDLPQNDFYCLDKLGQSIANFKWPKNLRLLLGEEGPGFPNNLEPKGQLSIPMNVNVESLNASHACSLAMYSYYSYFLTK